MRTEAVVLLLAVGLGGACESRRGPFRGFLRWGPEQMSLQPCDVPWSGRWWYELAPTAGTSEGIEGWKVAQDILDAQPRCDLGTLPCTLQEVYVEVDGEVTAPGKYGHLGAYERKVTITRVLYASRVPPRPCSQPR